jgi:hypothetical protein
MRQAWSCSPWCPKSACCFDSRLEPGTEQDRELALIRTAFVTGISKGVTGILWHRQVLFHIVGTIAGVHVTKKRSEPQIPPSDGDYAQGGLEREGVISCREVGQRKPHDFVPGSVRSRSLPNPESEGHLDDRVTQRVRSRARTCSYDPCTAQSRCRSSCGNLSNLLLKRLRESLAHLGKT